MVAMFESLENVAENSLRIVDGKSTYAPGEKKALYQIVEFMRAAERKQAATVTHYRIPVFNLSGIAYNKFFFSNRLLVSHFSY